MPMVDVILTEMLTMIAGLFRSPNHALRRMHWERPVASFHDNTDCIRDLESGTHDDGGDNDGYDDDQNNSAR